MNKSDPPPIVVSFIACILVACLTWSWAPFVEPYVGDLDIMWGLYNEDMDFCGLRPASWVNWKRDDPVISVRFADLKNTSVLLTPKTLSACQGHTCYVEKIFCYSHAEGAPVFTQETASDQPKLQMSRFPGGVYMPSIVFGPDRSSLTPPQPTPAPP